jgi:hypothetical protein
MARMYKYNYMDVQLPGDLFAGLEGKELNDALADIAINEARERFATWAIPAVWSARLTEGTPSESFKVVYRVCRKSLRCQPV